MRFSAFLDKWLGRLSSGWTLVGPFVPGTLGAIVMGWASTGVGWISQFGAFGWLATGLVAFVLITAALALAARTKLWRIEAKNHARLAGDSSPFDPMARVYENKRLFLRDIAPSGRLVVSGKNFIGCEIIGPGDIAVILRSSENKPFPKFAGNFFYNMNCIQIAGDSEPQNAISFVDCDFDGCHFYSLNMLFYHRIEGVGWNWITPTTVVSEPDLPLLEARKTEVEGD